MRPSPFALALCAAIVPWTGARTGDQAEAATAPVEPVDLSVVLCGRNDGHAGDFLSRVKWSLLSIGLGLCQRRRRISAEIAFVEWRPPEDTEPLRSIVPKWYSEVLQGGGFGCPQRHLPRLRFITVTEGQAQEMLRSFEWNRQSPKWDGMHMLQWHCKNVGVLRAKGRFVLVTNADDFFTPELFDVLASVKDLRTDSFYRAQTTTLTLNDVPFSSTVYDSIFQWRFYELAQDHMQKWAVHDGVLASGVATQLCKNTSALTSASRPHFKQFWADYDAAFGVHLNSSSLDYNGLWYPWNLYMDLPGDFLLASKDAWEQVRGAPLVLQNHNVDMLLICRFAARFRQVVLVNPCAVATLDHPSMIHDQFRQLDKEIRRADEELAIFRSRLREARARLLRAGREAEGPLLQHPLLGAEVRRLHLQVQRKGRLVKRLRERHELRIDNVFDSCREPFRPFASERRSSGIDPQDWGFAWMDLAEDIVTWQ